MPCQGYDVGRSSRLISAVAQGYFRTQGQPLYFVDHLDAGRRAYYNNFAIQNLGFKKTLKSAGKGIGKAGKTTLHVAEVGAPYAKLAATMANLDQQQEL